LESRHVKFGVRHFVRESSCCFKVAGQSLRASAIS